MSWHNTFGKKRLKNIKRARTILKNEAIRSGHNNRDTQMLELAITVIDRVIAFNEEEK